MRYEESEEFEEFKKFPSLSIVEIHHCFLIVILVLILILTDKFVHVVPVSNSNIEKLLTN